MNSCVNNSIAFPVGRCPNFPLMPFHGESLKDLQLNTQTYCQEPISRLNTINDIEYRNDKVLGQQMEEEGNLKANELKLQIGDYLYLQRKFKPIFKHPFALNNILSAPIVMKRQRNIQRILDV